MIAGKLELDGMLRSASYVFVKSKVLVAKLFAGYLYYTVFLSCAVLEESFHSSFVRIQQRETE